MDDRVDPRSSGSRDDFDRDWAEALRTGDPRWLVYPEPNGRDQVSLFEWVKAMQVVEALDRRGVVRGRVLEYGCGAAGMASFLKTRGYDSVALDVSAKALEVARLNDARHRGGPVPLDLVAADTLELPMADATFDAAMSFGLLEHFEPGSLRPLMTEVVRVLRPGGVFVADIIPGGFNARAFGSVVSFGAAAAARLAAGRVDDLPALKRGYFEHYFETAFGPVEWRRFLAEAGLVDVEVRVCRPFPPLALRGAADRAYVGVMRALMPLWRAFDRAPVDAKSRWGWMLLAVGTRPG